ncbi:MAG TPA: phage holin family protein [Thermoanaerobaculia bacterium]|nr:phage holin family protein [Thermoanaerobaculia bacterium]
MSNTQFADRSLSTIAKDLSADLGRLVSTEIALAKKEIQENITRIGRGAGLFGGAGVVGIFAVEFLLLAGMFGLAAAMPLWAAALIVGVLLAVVAGVLAFSGKKNVAGASVVPKQAIASVKTDIKAVKDDVQRMRSSV